jgi:hypothetical protein
MSHSASIALVVVFLAAWSVFSWWSWTFVRRRAAGGDSLLVRRYGLSFFGGMMLLTLTLQGALSRVDAPLAEAVRMRSFWLWIPPQLLTAFPIAVWCEYFFHSMLKVGLEGFGFRRPPRG